MDRDSRKASYRMITIGVGVLVFLIAVLLIIRFAFRGQGQPINQPSQNSTQSETGAGISETSTNEGDSTSQDSNEVSSDSGNTNDSPENDSANDSIPSAGVIAVVGEESIYSRDLDYELTVYPSRADDELIDRLIDKMVRDSIILQAGAEEGYVTLNNTIFNNSRKDYPTRMEAVQQVRDAVLASSIQLEGAVVSIWFNNVLPGPIGYEDGKELAFNKISPLRNAVASGQMSIEQAAQQIQQDREIGQADTSYKSNAYFSFAVDADQEITIDPEVDTIIRSLEAGEVSEVLAARDRDARSGEVIDALYLFAQVTNRSSDTSMSFEEWFDQAKDTYSVVLY